MRPARTFVAEVGPEVALPIARDYCRRHRVPCVEDSGEAMWWAGAIVRGRLCAVMGLAPLGSDSFFVAGIFTDGSADERRAVRMFAQRLAELPGTLVGALHVPDARCQRTLRLRGWDMTRFAIMGVA